MARRKQKLVVKKLRFYSGQSPDDEIIHWLEQFEGAGRGVEGAAVKAALARGIGRQGDKETGRQGDKETGRQGADVDLDGIRRVVESAVVQAMGRFEVGRVAAGAGDEDEEAEGLLDCLGGALVLDDDDISREMVSGGEEKK